MTATGAALSLRQVSAGYHGTNIIDDVSVDIAPAEIFTVIGPNGSGKSTLAKMVAGLIPAVGGEILLGGSRLTGLSAPERVRAGLGYVPQEFNIFPNLTIGENLAVAAEFLGRSPGSLAERREAVLAMFPETGGRLHMRAGLLSGGERQLLAFACAMMSGPTLLLLDEPSAGLSPIMTAKIIDRITSINKAGVTIFMIEQNVTEALRISSRVMVLVAGGVRVLASPGEFGTKYDLHRVYLS